MTSRILYFKIFLFITKILSGISDLLLIFDTGITKTDKMAPNPKFQLILLFLSLQFNSSLIFSQPVEYIDGKVINTITQEPVAFATVRLKKNQLGVYANTDGDFKIISNPGFSGDSIIITCIGYKRFSGSFNDLKHETVNKFQLIPSDIGIGEISISAKKTRISSTSVIAKALKNIPVNYPQRPFSFISYYRDYQKREGNYINLNEGLIQTLDNGFNLKSTENKYRLLDYRENMDFPRMDITPYYDNINSPEFNGNKIIPYANLGDQNGNELFILMVHDALRDFDVRSFSFIYTLSTDFLFNHEFSDPVPVYNNKLLLYKISFRGRIAVTNDLSVTGAIYIQPRTWAIHKIEYLCSFTDRKEEKKMFNIDIEYGHEPSVDSLMCLKYISFNNIFLVKDESDDSWFRMTGCNWAYNSRVADFRRPVVSIGFNNDINPETASEIGNYDVSIGKKPGMIKDIRVTGNKLLLELRDDNFPELDSVVVRIKNLEDIHGNSLDIRKSIELYQYRELFVQGYNDNPAFQDSSYIQFLPLRQNTISKYPGKNKYWMNSPEKIKNSSLY